MNIKREMINLESELSVSEQCKLISLNRSSYYSSLKEKTKDKYSIIKSEIEKIWTEHPFFGSRRIKIRLNKSGYKIGRSKVSKLMKELGIKAIYPKKNLSISDKAHKKYPYLLRDKKITYSNQVWSTDITYIKFQNTYLYLTAVIDWNSRYVLSWELSNTMDLAFCKQNLNDALKKGKPKIFNTDQGSQYTSKEFTNILLSENIKISMDGKGRALDNIFIERFWRTVKYEEIFIKDYKNVFELRESLKKYFEFYNNEREHQSLNYKTPAEIYFEKKYLKLAKKA